MGEFKLKSWPFCGDDDLKIQKRAYRDELGNVDLKAGSYWFIGCRGACFITGPTSDKCADDAIKLWNKRGEVNE